MTNEDMVKTLAEKRTEREYCLGFGGGLSEIDVKAMFRAAVQRLRALMTDRLFGRVVPKSPDEEAADQRLLDGDLDYLVPPDYTLNCQAQSQVVFWPTRLVIDDEAAEWYDVVDIKVGKNSQLASSGRLPGTSFKASVLRDLKMDTAQIAMFLNVQVVNVSGRPRRLPRIMMYGESAG